MFKRREPIGVWRQLREFFWPTMGFRRTFQYIRHRIVRLSDSSHKIAIGLACGAAISFTPLVGTHFIQAGVLAYFLRGNLLASLIGTFVGNPWTFPFLWWSALQTGGLIFSIVGVSASNSLPDIVTIQVMWNLIWDDPLRLFLPWVIGGYLLAMLAIFPAYLIFFKVVRAAKAARARAKLRRMHKIARQVTGQKK